MLREADWILKSCTIYVPCVLNILPTLVVSLFPHLLCLTSLLSVRAAPPGTETE